MPLFGPPNIDKLMEKKNIKGLIQALSYKKDKAIRADALPGLSPDSKTAQQRTYRLKILR